mmetsp:Transcript_92368/g.162927  ORF Transcript_92368/g.162927 Transcript_92368/m.162927 type:complete len:96 (-) Transcript_92368:386-673(-)
MSAAWGILLQMIGVRRVMQLEFSDSNSLILVSFTLQECYCQAFPKQLSKLLQVWLREEAVPILFARCGSCHLEVKLPGGCQPTVLIHTVRQECGF